MNQASPEITSNALGSLRIEHDSIGKLSFAIDRAQRALIEQQHAEGYWHAALEANAQMNAEYIIFMHFMEAVDKDLEERLMFIESLETIKCLDEGVIESVADANIGSIMGIGFPGWTGGVLQYINGYEGGLAGFVARARDLAERYGERFEPPASLVEKAERGEIYSDAEALVTT